MFPPWAQGQQFHEHARMQQQSQQTYNASGKQDFSSKQFGNTTVMLRNLPNDYTRDMLVELLAFKGLDGQYDFLYLPFDFKKRAGLGYAFMNLVTPEDAMRAMESLQGFSTWKLPSHKVLQVSWSKPLQGLQANIERYRNSSVMHPDVPDHFKPLLFVDGVSAPFPPATRPLQPPVFS
jgi:hypothetical protein